MILYGDKESFDKVIALKDSIQMIASKYQNDDVEIDLESMIQHNNVIRDVIIALQSTKFTSEELKKETSTFLKDK